MIKLLSVLGLFLAFTAPTVAHAALKEIVLAPEDVFIPDGFDNNDRAEIVLHGYFSNTCYRASHATAQINGDKIVLKNMAYYEDDAPCMEMMIPWTTSVSVGVLKAGSYHVFVHQDATALKAVGSLPVAVATTKSIDEHLYAYVKGVTVKQTGSRADSITITGSFSTTCLYIKDVIIEQTKADVISVLPLLAVDANKVCANVFIAIPFKKTVKINRQLTQKSTLFHVRSLNGQALNDVETNILAQ
jgi:hypothetical protein